MNIKQTIRNLVLGGLLLIPLMATAFPATTTFAAKCGGIDTAVISCDTNKENPKKVEDTGVWGILIVTINIMTGGVGVLALAGLIYGAILYSSAGGSPEQVKKARTVFTNVVVGVVAFGGMFVLLNFLVPGVVFR
jgi:hypothetical protein